MQPTASKQVPSTSESGLDTSEFGTQSLKTALQNSLLCNTSTRSRANVFVSSVGEFVFASPSPEKPA